MTDHTRSPGIACIGGRHIWIDIHDQAGSCIGGWCPWCGTGVHDPDRITDDGQPIGFVPEFVVRVPDGFHRLPEDMP